MKRKYIDKYIHFRKSKLFRIAIMPIKLEGDQINQISMIILQEKIFQIIKIHIDRNFQNHSDSLEFLQYSKKNNQLKSIENISGQDRNDQENRSH